MANAFEWAGAKINYPIFVVFDPNTAQEEEVEVASYNAGTREATLATGKTFSKSHADAITINYSYGWSDTKGDPFYSGVTDDGLSRRDMAEFWKSLG